MSLFMCAMPTAREAIAETMIFTHITGVDARKPVLHYIGSIMPLTVGLSTSSAEALSIKPKS